MRKIKYLFSVPAGEKVTEKHLYRVLISSICSILVCMTCFISTTWALFTATVSNTDNVIQIGKFKVEYEINPVNISKDDSDIQVAALNEEPDTDVYDIGVYKVVIKNARDTDAHSVDGYCKVLITPASGEIIDSNNSSGETEQANEESISETSDQGISMTFYTERIPVEETIGFYVILSEPSVIEVLPVWGQFDNADNVDLLGNDYSVSGGDVFATVSSGDVASYLLNIKSLSLVGDGDTISENGEIIKDAHEGEKTDVIDGLKKEKSVSENKTENNAY